LDPQSLLTLSGRALYTGNLGKPPLASLDAMPVTAGAIGTILWLPEGDA